MAEIGWTRINVVKSQKPATGADFDQNQVSLKLTASLYHKQVIYARL